MVKKKPKPSIVTRIGLTASERKQVAEISERTGVPQARWLADAVRQRLEREKMVERLA